METTTVKTTNIQNYNNCFVLGTKRCDSEKTIKIPVYVKRDNELCALSGGKDGVKRHYYELSYEEATATINNYFSLNPIFTSGKHSPEESSVRISLYLDNAKYGGLHIFVIDFDKIDGRVETESSFFQAAEKLADKVTRSQGGGYHMFYGVNKEAATPLFDSINLLASKNAKSYVCKTGAVTADGKNKVDMFCDAYHFIYEWEPWDNTAGLTDKTQALFELINSNFVLTRSMDGGGGTKTSKSGNRVAPLQRVSEQDLRERMNERQQLVLADLKTMSADCNRGPWFSIGLDIYHVFGAELGGMVFHWWSSSSREKFNESGCAQTWENICERGPKTELRNMEWDTMLMVPAF